MIRQNKNMEKIMEEVDWEKKFSVEKFIDLKRLMCPKVKEIFGCYLMDLEDDFNESKIDLQIILQRYGDKTGFEATCNEVRINDFVDCNEKSDIIKISLLVMEEWEKVLKSQFKMVKFCLILDYINGYATLRFHKNREDEKNWLMDDLEKYELNSILEKNI